MKRILSYTLIDNTLDVYTRGKYLTYKFKKPVDIMLPTRVSDITSTNDTIINTIFKHNLDIIRFEIL